MNTKYGPGQDPDGEPNDEIEAEPTEGSKAGSGDDTKAESSDDTKTGSGDDTKAGSGEEAEERQSKPPSSRPSKPPSSRPSKLTKDGAGKKPQPNRMVQRWTLLVAVLLMLGVFGGGKLLGLASGGEGSGCSGDDDSEELAEGQGALTNGDCVVNGEQWNLYGAEVGGFCCAQTPVNGNCTGRVCALDPSRAANVALCKPQGLSAADCIVDGEQWNLYGADVGGFCCDETPVGGNCPGQVCAERRRTGSGPWALRLLGRRCPSEDVLPWRRGYLAGECW